MRLSVQRWLPWFLGAALFPYVALALFVHPCADEFGYAVAARRHGIWGAQSEFFHTTNGRYLSTLLMTLNPLRWTDEVWPSVFPLVAMALVFISFYLLIARFFEDVLSRRESALGALLFLVLYLFRMPGLADGIYWYGGFINHTLTIPLFALAYSQLMKVRGVTAKHFSYRFGARGDELALGALFVLCGVAICGLNEASMFIWDVGLLALFVAGWLRLKRIDWAVFAAGVFSLAGSLVVLLAPATKVRSGSFENSRQIGHTLLWCLINTPKHFLRFLGAPYLIAVVLLFFALAPRLRGINPYWRSARCTRHLLMIFLPLLFLFFVPSYWGMGGLPPRRNLNILCFLHYALMTPLIFNLLWRAERLRARMGHWLATPARRNGAVALGAALLLGFGHQREVIVDLATRALPYERAYQERRETILKSAGQDLEVPPVAIVESFVFDDITEEPTDWRNGFFSEYYGLRSIRSAGAGSSR